VSTPKANDAGGCLFGAIYKASARIFDLISLPELRLELPSRPFHWRGRDVPVNIY